MIMATAKRHFSTRRPARVLLLAGAMLLAACNATTTPQQKLASIEIQEAVGFTITEDVQIPEPIRLQYFEALAYLQSGNFERGIAILEQVSAAVPLVTAPKIDLGVAYDRMGDLEAAEKYLLQAIELNPEHPAARNELGIVYRKTGRFAAARQQYEAAIAVYPGYHHARRNLAILCDLYLADMSCAKDQYEAYMATVPADTEVSMWMADLENRMAKRD